MKCEECRDKFSEYVDGELNADDAAEIETHLEACVECRRELELMNGITFAVVDLPRHCPSMEAILNISRTIHKTAPEPARKDFGPVLDINELV